MGYGQSRACVQYLSRAMLLKCKFYIACSFYMHVTVGLDSASGEWPVFMQQYTLRPLSSELVIHLGRWLVQ